MSDRSLRHTKTSDSGRPSGEADGHEAHASVADQMPDFLGEEMIRAARLADDLAERGLQLRYDKDARSGRIVCTLCTAEGARVRDVPLTEALGDVVPLAA